MLFFIYVVSEATETIPREHENIAQEGRCYAKVSQSGLAIFTPMQIKGDTIPFEWKLISSEDGSDHVVEMKTPGKRVGRIITNANGVLHFTVEVDQQINSEIMIALSQHGHTFDYANIKLYNKNGRNYSLPIIACVVIDRDISEYFPSKKAYMDTRRSYNSFIQQ